MMKLKNVMMFSILAVFMMFALNGCVSVSLSDGSAQMGSINGKGEMVTKEFSVSEYSAVRIDANVAVVYSAVDSDVVKVEMQENLFEHLDVSIKDGQLVVSSDKNFITKDDKTPVIYIAASTLNEMVFEGIVEIKDSDAVKSSELHLLVDGSLNGSLEVDTDDLSIDFNGIGNIVLSGRAAQAGIMVDGAGNLNALELDTKNSSVEINGTGSISLSCSDTLDIQIDGAGTVNYRGNPSLQQEISGVGSVNQVK